MPAPSLTWLLTMPALFLTASRPPRGGLLPSTLTAPRRALPCPLPSSCRITTSSTSSSSSGSSSAVAASRPSSSRGSIIASSSSTATIVTSSSSSSSSSSISTNSKPSERLRQRTADDLLTLFAGGSLRSKAWERKLRASYTALAPVPRQQELWAALNARVAAEGPAAVRRLLDPETFPVPDIEGAAGPPPAQRCQLTTYPDAQRFAPGSGLNSLMAGLFHALANGSAWEGLPQVRLSRWDLFHAHLFYNAPRRAVGLLFHAKEYPAFDAARFPLNLGFCQRGSRLAFDARSMDRRNAVLWEGRLFVLDVGEGSVLHDTLIMDGLQPVRTVLESDFGRGVVDVNYFESLCKRPPEERVFVCRGSPAVSTRGVVL